MASSSSVEQQPGNTNKPAAATAAAARVQQFTDDELFFGTVDVYFRRVPGDVVPYRTGDAERRPDDVELRRQSRRRRRPVSHLGPDYVTCVLPAIPAADLCWRSKDQGKPEEAAANKRQRVGDVTRTPVNTPAASQHGGGGGGAKKKTALGVAAGRGWPGPLSACPLLKVSRRPVQADTDHAPIRGIVSGVRSALIKAEDGRWYRLKGCGNHEQGFTFACIVPRSPWVNIRGSAFEHTALRELFMTDEISGLLRRRAPGLRTGNLPRGLYRYELGDTPYRVALPRVPRCCTVFRTRGERRLADHVLTGLDALLNWLLPVTSSSPSSFSSSSSSAAAAALAKDDGDAAASIAQADAAQAAAHAAAMAATKETMAAVRFGFSQGGQFDVAAFRAAQQQMSAGGGAAGSERAAYTSRFDDAENSSSGSSGAKAADGVHQAGQAHADEGADADLACRTWLAVMMAGADTLVDFTLMPILPAAAATAAAAADNADTAAAAAAPPPLHPLLRPPPASMDPRWASLWALNARRLHDALVADAASGADAGGPGPGDGAGRRASVRSVLGYVLWRCGWEIGSMLRVLEQEGISWGTYQDAMGGHCNAHPNNVVLVREEDDDDDDDDDDGDDSGQAGGASSSKEKPAPSSFLAFLDFDMAYHRSEHLYVKTAVDAGAGEAQAQLIRQASFGLHAGLDAAVKHAEAEEEEEDDDDDDAAAGQRDDAEFDKCVALEAKMMAMALAGDPEVSTGVQARDVCLRPLRPLKWALRDTLCLAYQSALRGDADSRHPVQAELRPAAYALLRMALCLTAAEIV